MAHKQLTIAVGIMEREDKFLILRRVDAVPMWHHKWEFPGGKIEPGETPLEALRREVGEETGLVLHDPELLGVYTHHWTLPEVTQQTFLVVYRAKAGSDEVVVQEGENDAYQWVTIDEFFAINDHLEANRDMAKTLYVPYLAQTDKVKTVDIVE